MNITYLQKPNPYSPGQSLSVLLPDQRLCCEGIGLLLPELMMRDQHLMFITEEGEFTPPVRFCPFCGATIEVEIQIAQEAA